MAAQPLGSAAAALLLDRLEHVGHLARVVAGARHDLRAQQVGLPLVLAAVLQEVGAEAELRALRDDAAGRAADDGAENLAGDGADLELLTLGGLRGAVAKRDVAISCAITPAISPSVFAASIIPRLRNIGPPGSANALISFWFTTSNV